MRVSLQPAYILHSRPYRNTSKLLEIFSRDYGRCTLVARGARKGQSRIHSSLIPFVPLLISWQGSGEIQTLTGSEAEKNPLSISASRLLNCFYLNEILLRLLPKGDSHPQLYEAYAVALENMAEACNEEVILRNIEKLILNELGYGLLLDCDAQTGEEIDPDSLYCYDFEKGPVHAGTGYNNGVMIRGKTLHALNSGDLQELDILKEAKKLMRMALAQHLGDRPLKSRELYLQQRQLLLKKTEFK
ncbi:MAG: DNA repair protein RecO [Gammaproteobacteria bacterium]|nr:DNA repair protein RecO [Gammaproteobacteria bacterium]